MEGQGPVRPSQARRQEDAQDERICSGELS